MMRPDDTANRALTANVHPEGWINPTPSGRYNLVVIGAGTAGLVSAVGAASLGAKVAIVERHLMGGDCLNFGCVPSKALIASGRAAAIARGSGALGVHADPSVDFGLVMARMRGVRAGLSRHDSATRLAGLGIDVFLGQARFSGADTVEVDGQTLRFARAVIATGARAAVPEIPGLLDTGFLTNETVFSLTELPPRLTVIGAGPIGCELAQTFRRLGADVTLISIKGHVLPREDPDAAAIVEQALTADGVRLELGVKIVNVERTNSGTAVTVERGGDVTRIDGDQILVATGRAPNVEGLGLETAGIAFTKKGITVDDTLRTTNRRVYAAGDICSRYQFTHAADAMARVVIRNALFFGRARASALVIPWATYTDPEIAHVGLYERDAQAQRLDIVTLTVPLADVDRAVLDNDHGFARVHVAQRSGRIVGATMVGAHAGELIGEMALAIRTGSRMGVLAETIHPYPTVSEAWRKLGDMWNRRRLTPRARSIMETVLRWRR